MRPDLSVSRIRRSAAAVSVTMSRACADTTAQVFACFAKHKK